MQNIKLNLEPYFDSKLSNTFLILKNTLS
jgi:hypothetical protein